MTDRPPGDLVVRYSWVSLTAWTFVSLIGLAASIGALAGTDRDFGDIVAGVVGAPLALGALGYLAAKLIRRPPRYVIGSAGFEDHRAFEPVFVPWHAVSGVSTGRHSRGRRCIFLSLKDGAVVSGAWPWWMRGWGWQSSEVRLSDWLVTTPLDELEAEIRARLGDG